jgi:ELWxxDGT repeat protein
MVLVAVLLSSALHVSTVSALAPTPEFVSDVNPSFGQSSNINFLLNVGGTAYFMADDGTHGYELWKSDGTAAGTVLIKDINPGPAHSIPFMITNMNGTLFFAADDGVHGAELWKSDGTAAGTVLVKDINSGSGDSSPNNFIKVGNTLFFGAVDSSHGHELWKTDGTTAGTALVKDINPGTDASYPATLRNVNGMLFFVATDATHGGEIWKSDGTTAGTVMVTDITSGAFATSITEVNGTIFFVEADNQAIHGTLWKTDGTTAGTSMISSSVDVPNPYRLTAMNGNVYFMGVDATYGNELWKSDGTTAGTVIVRDIRPGSIASGPNYMTNVNGTLMFSANDGTALDELWKSDGTAAGTVKFSTLYPQSLTTSDDFNNSAFGNIQGHLYFTTDDGVHGRQLWKSDGTTAGTVMVTDMNQSGGGADPNFLSYANGVLFFTAVDAAHGRELWKLQDETLSAPTGLSAASPTSQPVLSWSPVSGTDHYDVYRDGTKISSPTATSYTDNGAMADGNHAYRVTAVSSSGVSSVPSTTITVVVDKTAPVASNLAMSGLTTITIPVLGITFSFFPGNATNTTISATVTDNLSGAVSAEYYFDSGTHTSMTVSGSNATASSVSLAGLSNGQHTLHVRTRDAAGNWSAVADLAFRKL